MKNDDNSVAILNAIPTNTAIKVFFGGFEPEDADRLARLLFTGHLDLAEWKPGTERPVAVGSEMTTVANWSRAEMQAETEMTSRTLSYSRATARGTSTTSGSGSGTALGTGESAGQVLTPPFSFVGPNAPNATIFPTPLSQSRGTSSSDSSFDQSSQSSSESFSSIETESEAETHAHGRSRGTSRSEGESEVFITQYEWMPSAMYTLQEQLHRVTGELMNLARREVFVKIRGARPFRARTADVPASFRSARFKELIMPRYRSVTAARSPYIRSCHEVDAEIAARFAPSLPEPEAEVGSEAFDCPDPPPPPDAHRSKPNLRIVRPEVGPISRAPGAPE